MKRIGYGKIGRSIDLDVRKASVSGGDADVIRALQRLATTHPDIEWVIMSRNSGEDPLEIGYPENVTNLWRFPALKAIKTGMLGGIDNPFWDAVHDQVIQFDGIVMWAGQHGTTNTRGIPSVKNEGNTSPYTSAMEYVSYLVQAINAWRAVDPKRRQEVWLVPDPRNYIKARDLRFPITTTVIAQFAKEYRTKHEQYGHVAKPHTLGFHGAEVDPESPANHPRWTALAHYMYGGLELTALPHPNHIDFEANHERPHRFGLVTNENRTGVPNARRTELERWVLSYHWNVPIYGIWTETSRRALGINPSPVPYHELFNALKTFRTSFTMPASGSGWATAKPWECFATGVICFFHPGYDTQGHIIPRNADDRLSNFLRLEHPADLWSRVKMVESDPHLYKEIAQMQYDLFVQKWNAWRGGIAAIEHYLNLPQTHGVVV